MEKKVLPSEKYKERIRLAKNKMTSYKKEMFFTSWLRVAVFMAFVGTGYWLFKSGNFFGWIFLILEIGCFLILLKKFVRAKKQHKFWMLIKDLNIDELKCLDHEFNHFEDGEEYKDISHNYSFDLDLFGKASLFQYLNRSSTLMGKNNLAGTLKNLDLENEKIIQKQKAIKELDPLLIWRQEFLCHGKLIDVSNEKLEGLKNWLNEKDVYSKIKYLNISLMLSPLIFGLLVIAMSFGIINESFIYLYISLSLIFVAKYLKHTNRAQNVIDSKLGFLKDLKIMLEYIEGATFNSKLLKEIQGKLKEGKKNASWQINLLNKDFDMFLARNNMILGIVLNIIALWDLRYMRKIEQWKNENGKNILSWLEQVGEMEKLLCFANFAFNNPNYTYPSLSKNPELVIRAVDMGHPLLPYKKRVLNSFKLILPKQLAIITGANMAGKSTFLRAVGVNHILGMAGAPVCAQQSTLKPLELLTSMRTADSLYENKSYFHSELLRLKFILDQLKEKNEAFIILDEILKGTNFKDQSVGARALLDKLLKLNGRGIVATHDLSLCKMDKDYPDAIENLSFNVSFRNGGLDFNYKLENGVCKQMNATYLMQNMGIIDQILAN